MKNSTIYMKGVIAEKSSTYKWWLLVIAMLATFMAVLDVTIVNVALPKILHQFNSSLDQGEWLATAYMLANILLLPVSGWLAMRYGFKKIFLVGLLLFTFGSVWCMVSSDLSFLIVGRFIEGLGSGIITPIAMAFVIRNFEGKERALALGFWAAATAASISLGPILGGYLVDTYSWHSIFTINIPLGVITSVALFLIVREEKQKERTPIDIKGLALLWTSLPALLMLTTYIGRWNWWLWGAILGVTILLLIMLTKRAMSTKNPVIDLKLMRDRTFALTMIIMLLDGVILFAGNYILPIYVQHSLSYTAWQAGLIFLPVGIIQGVLGPLSGWFSRFIGNRILLLSGVLILVSYMGVSLWFTAATPAWLIMLSLYLRGVGNGLSFTALNTISLRNIKNEDLAQASGISNTIRQFAGSLGIALVTFSLSRVSGDFIGGLHTAFVMLFICAVLILIPTLLLKKKK